MIPAMNDEAVFIDATFGRGGHSRALLARLPASARLVAIDRDQDAVVSGQSLADHDPRLIVRHARFSELGEVLDALEIVHVDGVVMDLGVSSPQLDDPQRGFSFRSDGPLDMRMDQSSGDTAADWLNSAEPDEISGVIRTFGEERYARRIARAIVAARPLSTTGQLAEVVRQAIPVRGHRRTDQATKTFQAIRMQMNAELKEVEEGIDIAFTRLKPGGRLAVISFHSLEDRLVKKTFRRLAKGPELPRRLPIRAVDAPEAGKLFAGPVRASAEELAVNPRSRSATLRVLERVA